MTGITPTPGTSTPEGAASMPALDLRQTEGELYVQRMHEAAAYIKQQVGDVPSTLIILGSGLGGLADQVEPRVILPYREIPDMPRTRTDGHQGNLIIGDLDGREVAVFQGRVHCHDGLKPKEVAFGARVMASLGVSTVVVTNAAGGINPLFKVGDVMVINGMLTTFLPEDPSFGISHPELGPKFYPVTHPFDPALGQRFVQSAIQAGLRCHQGAYAFMPGPRFETATDIQFLAAMRLNGKQVVDAVGMSTVPEVLALKQMRGDALRVLGISVITNVAAGLSDLEPNDDEVKVEGAKVSGKLISALRSMGPLN
jgi:purine-nucleoside phosphorylase